MDEPGEIVCSILKTHHFHPHSSFSLFLRGQGVHEIEKNYQVTIDNESGELAPQLFIYSKVELLERGRAHGTEANFLLEEWYFVRHTGAHLVSSEELGDIRVDPHGFLPLFSVEEVWNRYDVNYRWFVRVNRPKFASHRINFIVEVHLIHFFEVNCETKFFLSFDTVVCHCFQCGECLNRVVKLLTSLETLDIIQWNHIRSQVLFSFGHNICVIRCNAPICATLLRCWNLLDEGNAFITDASSLVEISRINVWPHGLRVKAHWHSGCILKVIVEQ